MHNPSSMKALGGFYASCGITEIDFKMLYVHDMLEVDRDNSFAFENCKLAEARCKHRPNMNEFILFSPL
jgi:hypothetical protein